MRSHIAILLILIFAIAHSATGIFAVSATQPQTKQHSIEMLAADNANMNMATIVKDCCKKGEATSHSGNMHCPSDCTLFYYDIAVSIRHGQSVSWNTSHSSIISNPEFNFLRPPIA